MSADILSVCSGHMEHEKKCKYYGCGQKFIYVIRP
jgi:hypothetical protein